MASVSCNMHTVILIGIVILIFAFTEELFTQFPVLIKLFTDPINFILMIVLVILVLLIDIPCGILLSFVILYLAIWVKRFRQSTMNRFTDIAISSQMAINKYRSDSEFIYNNKVSPNGNLAPFQPTNKQPEVACFNPTQKVHDEITQIYQPNNDGYDTTGCRYDSKNSPQNLTKYGPPLALCSTYNGEQVKTLGTVFYPLNA
jgi:hypothetical protein